DTNSIEVGVRFQPLVDGYITGVRFFKELETTGTHIGNLWSSTGQLLASATFTSETASGWQQVTFAQPIAVKANTTYVVSYFAPNGRYAANTDYFTASGYWNGPLMALSNGQGGNGVYRYGATSGFPTTTWKSSNYWVDVSFTTTTSSPSQPPTADAGADRSS